MTITIRQGAVFASGLLLGVAGAWMLLRSHSPAQAPGNPIASPAAATAPQPKAQATVLAAAPSRPHPACPSQMLTTPGAGDGKFQLQADVTGKTAADVPAFILAGKEAAASGSPRDAEVAFVTACRIADKLAGEDSVAAADARYQLARHYAHVALTSDAAGAKRADMLARAELLYTDSLQTFRSKNGENHEKTRFAAEGLASVKQTMAQSGVQGSKEVQVATASPKAAPAPKVAAAPPPAPTAVKPPVVAVAPAPAPVPAQPPVIAAPKAQVAVITPKPAQPVPATRPVARPRPAERQVEVVEADPSVRQATGHARQVVAPSFDCSRARSPSERTICADAELAQLDRDLGRLHARARNAAPDARAFRRQNDEEWRWRESNCRDDRECLRRWYAHRRGQLAEDVDE